MSGAIPFDVDDNPTSKSWINVLSTAGDHDILNCNQKKNSSRQCREPDNIIFYSILVNSLVLISTKIIFLNKKTYSPPQI